MTLLQLVLRVVGISLIVVNIILFLTPTGVFPGFGVLGPPVDIVRERSGLRCDGYSSCNYEVYVINRSDQEQRIVALVKSSVDYGPCRSAPIALGPHEETVVNISPSVQPSMSTNPSAAIDALTRWDYVRVEYAEAALPSGSAQAVGAHLTLQVISLALGVALLAAAHRLKDRRWSSGEVRPQKESYFDELYRTGKLWEEMKRVQDDKPRVMVAEPPAQPVAHPSAVVSSTKFCRECGAKIPRDSMYSEGCGARLA